MKYRGRPRKSWVVQVNSLKKKLDLQGEDLNVKLIRKALDRREHEEFEVDLQHKPNCIFIGILRPHCNHPWMMHMYLRLYN